jgi:hypothetical protein
MTGFITRPADLAALTKAIQNRPGMNVLVELDPILANKEFRCDSQTGKVWLGTYLYFLLVEEDRKFQFN